MQLNLKKSFETVHHGKKDWKERKTHPGSTIYGWCARADDHASEGPIGEYLCREGKLRTISSIVQEATESRNIVVAHLANKIDQTNENLDELQYKYNEKTMSLSRMLEEKDKLHYAFLEGLSFICVCILCLSKQLWFLQLLFGEKHLHGHFG